ncbi:MAG: carboxypeptidase-like regulatory domain-containing protein [Armatimonadota bacterium]|nr:carboxypeptidase-like regulatory domain-containing protein [bacterium]MDW8320674.1 carboxypeptidase-like regulatory domain-containing protein [Armatimonadota bacterium]
MIRTSSLLALAAVLLCVNALAQPVIDGSWDPAYQVLAVQNTQTGFGDSNLGLVDYANGSELDVAYGVIKDGWLYLLLAGNLESNFNKLEIFFDTRPGGQNRLRGDNPGVDFGGLNRMGDDGSGNGLTFDPDFEADFWIGATGGGAPYRLYVNYAELGSPGVGLYLGNTGAASDGVLVDGNNPFGIRATINNSNVGGVTGGTGLGSGADVTTGVELAIPLSALGSPSGPFKVCVFINGLFHDYVSNQVLAGIGGGGNLGEPRWVNFGSIPGNQYFVVQPEAVRYRISGVIELRDYEGDVTQVPVSVQLRQNGMPVRTETVYIDAAGNYTITDVEPGVYDLAFKASHWLRVVVRGVEVTSADITGIDASLTNGDIDGDNEVTLFDFGALVAAFGSVPGGSNWNPDADLDGDLDVTLFDFGVLVRNFGAIGDE